MIAVSTFEALADEESAFSYVITAKAGYNDNPYLVSDDLKEDRFVTSELFGFKYNKVNETSNYSVVMNLAANQDHSESAADRYSGTIKTNYNFSTEKNLNSFKLDYTVDPTIQTEVFDSGKIIDSQKDAIVFGWVSSFQLNEMNSVVFDLTHSQTEFKTDLLVDNKSSAVGLAFNHQYSASMQLFVSGNYKKFSPENLAESNVYNLKLGANGSWSERLSYNGTFGTTWIFPELAKFQRNRLYNLTLKYLISEKDTGSISLSRSTEESSLGELQLRDKVAANLKHVFSERTVFSLNSSYQTTPGDVDSIVNSVKASHSLVENMSLEIEAKRTSLKDNGEKAFSNSINLSCSYKF